MMQMKWAKQAKEWVKSKEIDSILHFYPMSRYDSRLKKQARVMGLETGAPGVALPRTTVDTDNPLVRRESPSLAPRIGGPRCMVYPVRTGLSRCPGYLKRLPNRQPQHQEIDSERHMHLRLYSPVDIISPIIPQKKWSRRDDMPLETAKSSLMCCQSYCNLLR